MDQKDFVQDKFFDKGNLGVKIEQGLVVFILWLIVIYPLLVIINSIGKKPIWTRIIYHWDYAEGRWFTWILGIIFLFGIVIIGLSSLALLLRNNYFEIHRLQTKKLYNEEKKVARVAVLNDYYSERFGDADFRTFVKSYTVVPEKNLDNNFSRKLFADKGLDIDITIKKV